MIQLCSHMLYCIFQKRWFYHFRFFLHILSLFCLQINSVTPCQFSEVLPLSTLPLWGTSFFLLCVSSGDGILNISVCFLKDYCFSQFSLKKFQRLQLTAIHIAFNLHILTTSPLSIIQSKKPCLQDRLGKKICNQQMSNWT